MSSQGIRRNVRGVAFRVGGMLALIASLASMGALAQTPPDAGITDPPTRVGRLAYFSGQVSYSPAGDDQWVQPQLNRPIVPGDRLWSDEGGRVEVSLDSGSWFLGSLTSVSVTNLDDRVTQFQLQQGTLDVWLRHMVPGAIVEIDTPNIAFSLTQPGRYRVDVDAEGNASTVVVRNGAAVAYGGDVSYDVMAGQSYVFHGSDAHDNEFLAAPPYDEFDRWASARERRFENAEAARYVSPEVVGYADLDDYGTWSSVMGYGTVWFPTRVAAGWAPYRYGHWAWIAPWGWTWVDDAPWGFAPFHYGRWVYVDRGWGWIPGPISARPCYAPALVAFVGGAGFGVAISAGPAIGWFPLGPREVYRPPYSVTRNYFRQVNVSNTVINNTTNITNIYNNYRQPGAVNRTRVNYVNLHAPNGVTAVPPAAFARAQPVNHALVAVPRSALGTAQIERVARIAPQRAAFTGAAAITHAVPPAAVAHRPMVARVAPPPPPVPINRQLPVLERNPGVPISHVQANTLRREARVATPTVRMVAPMPVPRASSAAEPARAKPPRAGTMSAGAPHASAPQLEAVRPPVPASQTRASRPPTEQAPKPQGERAPRPRMEQAPKPQGERAPRPPMEQAPRPQGERAPRPPMEQAPRPQGERASRPPMEQAPRPQGERAPHPQAEHAQRAAAPRNEARPRGEAKAPAGKKEGEEKRGADKDRN